MLRIGIRGLEHGPSVVAESVPVNDPIWQELGFQLGGPVRVEGRLTAAGPGQYFWRGQLRTTLNSDCRRCLAEIQVPVEAPMNVLFTEDQLNDDPSAYVIPPRSAEIDLGQAVREELILAAPEFVVCREDCRGICPRCGADLNQGPCGCAPDTDPRWSAFEALKKPGPEESR